MSIESEVETSTKAARSAVTTHVLDAALGRPAMGVAVRLEQLDGDRSTVLAESRTDGDGRATDLGADRLDSGTYRLTFDTGGYCDATGQDTFYPEVAVTFLIHDRQQSHHVPVLLSPFAYSTYRGS